MAASKPIPKESHPVTTLDLQPCGVARLVSVVLGVPLADAFLAAGLELCPRCQQPATKMEYDPYCGSPHKGPSKRPGLIVPLNCDGCGILFDRPQPKVLRSAQKGQQGIFCTRQCSARNIGNTVGFGGSGKITFIPITAYLIKTKPTVNLDTPMMAKTPICGMGIVNAGDAPPSGATIITGTRNGR